MSVDQILAKLIFIWGEWSMLIVLLFLGQVHAQAPNYGNGTCEVPVNGEIQFVSGIAGCTEKKRSANGATVTYQQTSPQYDSATGRVVPVQKTFTVTVDKKDGNLVTTSLFEGEDAKKAALITTTTLNTTATDPQNTLIQTLVKQQRNGKDERFLVYDRNLCARFREAGSLQRDLQILSACSTVLPKYEDAANEWSKTLQASKTSLGVRSLSPAGVMYRPAATGSIVDLMAVASACNTEPIEHTVPGPQAAPPTLQKIRLPPEAVRESREKF